MSQSIDFKNFDKERQAAITLAQIAALSPARGKTQDCVTLDDDGFFPGPQETKFREWLNAELAKGLQGFNLFRGSPIESREALFEELNAMIAAPAQPDPDLL